MHDNLLCIFSIQVPSKEEEWRRIPQDLTNFNNCIGAMDGKHILIKPPPNRGSYYFNYKHSFSIVLLAIVDADYRFIHTDIGCNGRISDGVYLEIVIYIRH